MTRAGAIPVLLGFSALVLCTAGLGQRGPAPVTVDYPAEGALFPPDFAPPTVLWHDASPAAASWRIEIAFPDGTPGMRVYAQGERPRPGPIDPRCVSPTNELPRLTPEQASAHAWTPAPDLWDTLQKHSPATLTITGYEGSEPVSRGKVVIRTSSDSVGAPIFYRDVPLMPSQSEKGIIKPIPTRLLPYVAWRLRFTDERSSRTVLEGLHTCGNCHSFSRDGKTLGMDVDGPHNDKGLYAIVPVRQKTVIRNEDVISWKAFRGQMADGKRIGFMSQVSPDGRYVMTATEVDYYVANFKQYRFLQVFYPTRGILAFYDREEGRVHALPGADDARYVHANAVWSPDGSYLVFVRAKAKDAYPEGQALAQFANDPNENPIQYDLYRIPFNGGRGGKAVPIAGASANGMSNSFPKVSPDGRWIVFVKSRNGQLMRPDSQLYIVPAAGGEARRMRCNTALMNSWHSFSPNGRWLVFSSKSRSPYTQMFLTHIDEQGNDTPPVLIENATAANRAVNIPEFVNVGKSGLEKIEVPAAEFYRLYDSAFDLTERGQVEQALAEWRKALALNPDDANALTNFGALLLHRRQFAEAAAQFEKAIALKPEFIPARNNLGLLRQEEGKVDEAIRVWRQALEVNPESADVHGNLGGAFILLGRFRDAAAEWRESLRLEPYRVQVLSNLAWLLATCPDQTVRNGAESLRLAELAVKAAGREDARLAEILTAARAEAKLTPDRNGK